MNYRILYAAFLLYIIIYYLNDFAFIRKELELTVDFTIRESIIREDKFT
jgi:hypothetical protein